MDDLLVKNFRNHLRNATDEMTRLSKNCKDSDGRSCTEAGGQCVTDLDRSENGTYTFWCRKNATSITPLPPYEDAYEYDVYLMNLRTGENNDRYLNGHSTRIYEWSYPGLPKGETSFHEVQAKTEFGSKLSPIHIRVNGDRPVRYRIDQMLDHDECRQCNVNLLTRCHKRDSCSDCAHDHCNTGRHNRRTHFVGLSVVVCPTPVQNVSRPARPDCYRIFYQVHQWLMCSTGARPIYSLVMHFDKRSPVPLNVTYVPGYEDWEKYWDGNKQYRLFIDKYGGPETLNRTLHDWTYSQDELAEDLRNPDGVFWKSQKDCMNVRDPTLIPSYCDTVNDRYEDMTRWYIRNPKPVIPQPTSVPTLAPTQTPAPTAFRGSVSAGKRERVCVYTRRLRIVHW